MSGRFDDARPVVPDGLRIRRLRRERGWSRRECVAAIARASERASGRPETLSPERLKHVEETNEPLPYSLLCLVAAGLDCEPTELVREGG